MHILNKGFLVCLFFLFSLAHANSPIYLIWQANQPEYSWEEDWIQEMLSHVQSEIKTIVDLEFKVVVDRAIIVMAHTNPDLYKSYFEKYRKQGLKFGIIHISDENYTAPIDFYEGAHFILRNYWHKNYVHDRILFFPLGYKRGFWKGFNGHIKPASERKYLWSFLGQITKSTRISMAENMQKLKNGYLYTIPGFAHSSSLPPQEYRDILLDSIFIPCPRGWWNLDSFRVCEALECGCIPIVERTPFDYFEKLFGPYPFLSLVTWDDIPFIIPHLYKNSENVEILRHACHTWWLNYKTRLKEEIATLIGEFEGDEKFSFPKRHKRRTRARS